MSQASAWSVGGLFLDIAGALLLALALITKKPNEAIDASTPRYDFNAVLDIGNAQEKADAQVGAALLALGFVGQLASALGWQVSREGAIGAAVVVALAIDAAAVAFLMRYWRPHHSLSAVAARLEATTNTGTWWPILESYGTALGRRPPENVGISGMTIADYGGQLLGVRRWAQLVPVEGLPDVMTRFRRDIPGTAEYGEAHPAEA